MKNDPEKINIEALTITVLYDNKPFDERLKTKWGFSALIENEGHSLLFDTGGDSPTLLNNMRALGIDPGSIQALLLSHPHEDHTGGVEGMLQENDSLPVYLLPSFPTVFKRNLSDRTEIIEAQAGQEIIRGMYTTGEMGEEIPEQALVIQTSQGLVMITGCAHPGIVNVIRKASDLFEETVIASLGGFHLKSKGAPEIKAILSEFRGLGVRYAAPSHCTGKRAISLFKKEYRENFIRSGAGKVVQIDDDLRADEPIQEEIKKEHK
jgi:7,8-dihydropterin-6-yl-methyl-4-(beta-D-ribofuranosyl)aminobenzene 5'-phosphate synthase